MAIDSSGIPHTAAQMASWTRQAIVQAEAELGVKICAVVGDNAQNMINSRGLLDPHAQFTLGCQSHLLNLVFKDFMKEKGREQLLAGCVTVLKAIKWHQGMSAQLKQLQRPRPVLPADTRWGSVYDTLLYYNANWPYSGILLSCHQSPCIHLSQVCASHLKPGDIVRRTVVNEVMNKGIADLVFILQPLAEAGAQ